jgi:hypothetical protein
MELRIRTVPLNSASKIDAIYLPSYVDDVLEYANLAAFPATGETGVIYVALDTNKIYRWSGSAYVEISPSAIPPVTSVNTKTGDVVLDKTDIGLGNVDNTSDADKPISDDTQDALDLKYDASNPAGYITAAEVPESPVLSVNQQVGDVFLDKYDIGLENVDNTSDADKPISDDTQDALDLITDVNWTGDYNNGTTYAVGDGVMFNGASFRMINFIGAAGYAPPAYPGSWLQVTDYVSANDIGLGNVDNTSDLDKPISTATQTALDDKANENLDNLTATAIPDGINLESISTNTSATTGFQVRTKTQTTSNSGSIRVISGDVTGDFTSGGSRIWSGDNLNAQKSNSNLTATGLVTILSGSITSGTGSTGNVTLNTGRIQGSLSQGNTGPVSLSTGNNDGIGNTGDINFTTGEADEATFI